MRFGLLKGAVLQTLSGDRQGPRQPREINRELFLPEQPDPLADGDATEHTRPD